MDKNICIHGQRQSDKSVFIRREFVKIQEGVIGLVHSIWAVLPPVITIILALATKEVYTSLFTGVLVGSFMYSGFNIIGTIDTVFKVMNDKIGGNVYILMFMVMLGIFVAAVNKSGASEAYGEWAAKVIKGRRMAMFVTMLLGILIFIDDYFNCLTVGAVMRPITDKFHISRAKLAYLIDATAAPICIIAPISSWAADILRVGMKKSKMILDYTVDIIYMVLILIDSVLLTQICSKYPRHR